MISRLHIGGRVLKTAVAITIAVAIAHYLGFEDVSPAALIALFSIQKTFHHSLMQSLGKLGSVLLGAVLGSAVAYVLGDHAITYGLVTFLALTACLTLNLKQHIPPALITGVIMIPYQVDIFQYQIILERILVAMLGAVSALAINYFFSPNYKQQIMDKVCYVDRTLRQMLMELSEKIQHPTQEKDQEFLDKLDALREVTEEGLQLSKLFQEEQRYHFAEVTLADIYRNCFRTFEHFIDYIEEMYRLTRRMTIQVPQAESINKLMNILIRMQKNVIQNRKIPYKLIYDAIQNLEDYFDKSELPTTREEFKTRASLYHIFKEQKRYHKRIRKISGLKLDEPLL